MARTGSGPRRTSKREVSPVGRASERSPCILNGLERAEAPHTAAPHDARDIIALAVSRFKV